MKKNFLLLLLLSLGIVNCNSKDTMRINTSYCENFELSRYLGTWYEIARLPNSFEKGLVGVTANYSLRKDGKVRVINSGLKNSLNGVPSTAKGKAKFALSPDKGYLKVSFFLFFYADYRILVLDKDYKYALVSSSSDKYLWILSRSPVLPESTYSELVDEAKSRGFNISKLERVEQKSLRKFEEGKTI